MIQSRYLSSIFFSLLLVTGLAGAQEAATEAEQPAAEAAESPAAAAEADVAAEAMPAGSVARSAFTTAVQDHEPVDQLTSLANDNDKVYFFTELVDLQGQKAVHRWEYNGEVVAEVPFNVGGNRWRVWSSKNLQPEWTGSWKVSVINGAGDVIAIQSLQYEAAPAQPASTEAGDEPAAPAEMPTSPEADKTAPAEVQ